VPEKLVATDQWGQVIYHDDWNTLELKWLPSTKEATEAQDRATMAMFAAETEKRKPQFLIVDATEFAHRWDDDMMPWRDREIIPHYNAGGVTKFAFVTGEGVPFPTVETGADPAPDGPATFPTGWFKTRAAAYQWLADPRPLRGTRRTVRER
jgi:hypothetical protein